MLWFQRRQLLFMPALAWGSLALAQSRHEPPPLALQIVTSDATAPYADVARLLTGHLAKAGLAPAGVQQITAAELAQALRQGALPQPRLFVALGVEAASTLALSRLPIPVLSALLPRSSWQRLLQDSGRRASSQFTALYLDQPLGRQMSLIRLALPKARRLGVLLGPESGARKTLLQALASSHGLSLIAAQVTTAADIFAALRQVLDDCDVLLALADPQVFNSMSIQNILLAAFRAGVPLVGFSPAYVRAGALLSLHATPAQAALQVAVLVQEALQGKGLPASPVESSDFEVGINAHVARSMGLAPDAQALRQALREAEGLP